MLNTQVFEDIEANFSGTGVDWNTLSYGGGHITLDCTAKKNSEPAEAVGRFFEQDIFDNITYNGFSLSEGEAAAEGVAATEDEFTFTMEFDIREVEVEEETEEDTGNSEDAAVAAE